VDRRSHWERIYATRAPDLVSWYEAVPTVSLRWVHEAIARGARSVIDIGGGASTLVDHLVDLELERVAVLDVSERALAIARARLGSKAADVEWIVGDVVHVQDLGRFDVWHDRAVFHFLTDADDRKRYVSRCRRTISPGGTAIMATFALDGPETCSGLRVCRYGASELARECGPAFTLVDSEPYRHTTPRRVVQSFLYASFRRAAPAAA
jgi:2-polyprenyl-3-methyl-5-hydroxy-6-metoxy-1,4-benzoquinol methylase